MKWTQEDLKFLRDNVNEMTNREIGKVLGRSKNGIRQVMLRSGIERSREAAKKFMIENAQKGTSRRKKLEFKNVPCELYPELGDCTICISHIANGEGYPQIQRNGKRNKVAIYLWEQKYGEIPKGMCALHKCDNPQCVRLSHLFLGTKADNIQDAYNKGRRKRLLTAKQAVEIFNSNESHKILMVRYSVYRGIIDAIKRRRTYKSATRFQ